MMRNKAPLGTETGAVRVYGLVAQPRTFTLDDLAALPQVTRTVTFITRSAERTVTYTGPLLRDMILAAGGVVEEQRLDRLHAYLLARSASGYEVVFSWGEIDPNFGDGQFMIAYLAEGKPLDPTEGAVRLVVPKSR
jgi:DMSO/TMAO reductase YedYZ molybdopterin-dependent catalytic subunit